MYKSVHREPSQQCQGPAAADLAHSLGCCALLFPAGIMGCVCVVELWPEALKCRRNNRMWAGIAAGAVLMGVTLMVM